MSVIQNRILNPDAAIAYVNQHPGLHQPSPQWNHVSFQTSNAQLFN